MPRTQTILNFTQRLPGLDIRLAPRPHIPVERNGFFDETWHFPSEAELTSTATTLPKKTRSVTQKNKQHKGIENFIFSVKCKLGLTLESAGKSLQGRSQSKCTHCSAVIVNILERWARHRPKCEGLKNKTSINSLRLAVTAGGDKHRNRCCDAYAITFWTYKNKLPFTSGEKVKQVMLYFIYVVGYGDASFRL